MIEAIAALNRFPGCEKPISRSPKTHLYVILKQVMTCYVATDKYLKVIYHSLYSMNNFVTNKSKLPQDMAQVLSCGHLRGSHDSQSPHVWLSCDHMIGSHDSQSPNIRT